MGIHPEVAAEASTAGDLAPGRVTALPMAAAMMQAMAPECMSAMHQMMQGGMMQGMMGAPNEGAAPANESLPEFTRAYVEAMNEMHGPMMDGVMATINQNLDRDTIEILAA